MGRVIVAYSSLFKQDVRITQAYKGASHKGLDLSTGKVEQPVYLPKKAIEGYVWKVLSGYSYGGKYYANSPIIYIKHKDGSGSRYIHSYTKNVKVKVGDTIKAGGQVCATGNSGYSFGDHLHFEWLKKWDDIYSHTDPVPLIFNENTMDFKKGDRVQFTAIQNIRSGSGTKYSITRSSVVGETATIIDGPRVADGYTWFDMKFDIGGSGWVAGVDKFKLFTGPVVPPEQSECEKRVSTLESEIEGLRIELRASEEEVSKLRESIVSTENVILELEGELEELKDEASDLGGALEELKRERDRIEREKLDLQEKLGKMGKESIVKRIVNIIVNAIVKFFNKN